MAVNHTLLHRIDRLQSEFEAELDLRALVEHRVDDRELLRQCAASGQMDERQRYQHERAGELPVSRDIGVECYLPPEFTNEPQPQDDTPAPNARWFLVIVVLAFALAAIRSVYAS